MEKYVPITMIISVTMIFLLYIGLTTTLIGYMTRKNVAIYFGLTLTSTAIILYAAMFLGLMVYKQ